MSYFPKSKNAARILGLLRKKPRSDTPWQRLVDQQFPRYKDDDLREVLIAIACPIVCVGVVNVTGWHKVCEKHADDAIAALRGTK
jgi:hypothetical protein